MKKILFVINTMGMGGAERALISLFNVIDRKQYDITLLVMLEQGELFSEVPDDIKIIGRPDLSSVLSMKGRIHLACTVLKKFCYKRNGFKKLGYIRQLAEYMKLNSGYVMKEKLLWRVISDGTPAIDTHFDLAVAYTEGAAAYYVADHVNADKKAVFVHIDYDKAGYSRLMDQDSFDRIDRIFTVSKEIQAGFLKIHPECRDRLGVFENVVDQDRIIALSKEKYEGYPDDGDKFRILTVGRLTQQKAYDLALRAMLIIQKNVPDAVWYVIGEGPLEKQLKEDIANFGLTGRFVLLGRKINPYPYFKDCDLYVHATRFEGKSIAVQEAKTLGRAVIVSDEPGNREQVINGINGELCRLDPADIANAVLKLYNDRELMTRLGKKAAEEKIDNTVRLEELIKQVK